MCSRAPLGECFAGGGLEHHQGSHNRSHCSRRNQSGPAPQRRSSRLGGSATAQGLRTNYTYKQTTARSDSNPGIYTRVAGVGAEQPSGSAFHHATLVRTSSPSRDLHGDHIAALIAALFRPRTRRAASRAVPFFRCMSGRPQRHIVRGCGRRIGGLARVRAGRRPCCVTRRKTGRHCTQLRHLAG